MVTNRISRSVPLGPMNNQNYQTFIIFNGLKKAVLLASLAFRQTISVLQSFSNQHLSEKHIFSLVSCDVANNSTRLDTVESLLLIYEEFCFLLQDFIFMTNARYYGRECIVSRRKMNHYFICDRFQSTESLLRCNPSTWFNAGCHLFYLKRFLEHGWWNCQMNMEQRKGGLSCQHEHF